MNHTNRQYRSRRTRQLARIHALARSLRLSDAAYRNTLAALTGHRTAADLDEAGRLRVSGFLAREIATRQQPQAPTFEQSEIVTDDEALAILGIAA